MLKKLWSRLKPHLTYANVVAQFAHVGWGYLVPMKLVQYGVPLPVGVHVAATIFAGKEIIESVWGVWEPKQSWTSASVDFNFFVLGILWACY